MELGETYVLVGTCALAALLIVVGYFCGRSAKDATTKSSQSVTREAESIEPATSTSTANVVSNKRVKSKKKREIHQEFTHSWMVGALKGHTSPILDINLSSDGKFLASCAADISLASVDLEFEYVLPHCDETSNDSGVSTADSNPTSSPGKKQSLSRRQRKNRTRLQRDQQQESRAIKMTVPQRRCDRSRDESDKSGSSSSESGIGSQESLKDDAAIQQIESSSVNEDETGSDSSEQEEQPGTSLAPLASPYGNPYYGQYSHLVLCQMDCLVHMHQLAELSDQLMLDKLSRLVLTEEQLIRNGFPTVYQPEKLVLDPVHKTYIKQKEIFRNKHMVPDKVYFKNWRPKRCPRNKGRLPDQDNSSDDEESCAPGIIRNMSGSSGLVGHVIERSHQATLCTQYFEKYCQRCNLSFDKFSLCSYHPETAVENGVRSCVVCRKNCREPGCTVKYYHVWSGNLPGLNGPCKTFKTTPQPTRRKSPMELVYALDCEMLYTHNGLELAQVTMVDLHGTIVYNEHVYPKQYIVDYNTRFSGIDENNFHPRKTISAIQEDLRRFIDSDTILIGHGLENDLRALNLVHSKVIDTSLLFANGKNRTRLQILAQKMLSKTVQTPCHNAAEDARTTLELVLRFLRTKNSHDLPANGF